MIRILFICHGNICRSPMAEYVMQDLLKKNHLENRVAVASAATSTEEIGNDVHRGTRKILSEKGIFCGHRQAVRVAAADYDTYDYLIVMDQNNVRNLKRIVSEDPEKKVHLLSEFASKSGDIADPWYTGDFETTYKEVVAGCEGLLNHIKNCL